jgi:hypothetical protein
MIEDSTKPTTIPTKVAFFAGFQAASEYDWAALAGDWQLFAQQAWKEFEKLNMRNSDHG